VQQDAATPEPWTATPWRRVGVDSRTFAMI
jgi:hypothetical protein